MCNFFGNHFRFPQHFSKNTNHFSPIERPIIKAGQNPNNVLFGRNHRFSKDQNIKPWTDPTKTNPTPIKSPGITSFYSGTGRIAVGPRTQVPLQTIPGPIPIERGRRLNTNKTSRLQVNLRHSSCSEINRNSPKARIAGSIDGGIHLTGRRQFTKSATPVGPSNRVRISQEPRSHSVGPLGLPPPVDVNVSILNSK